MAWRSTLQAVQLLGRRLPHLLTLEIGSYTPILVIWNPDHCRLQARRYLRKVWRTHPFAASVAASHTRKPLLDPRFASIIEAAIGIYFFL